MEASTIIYKQCYTICNEAAKRTYKQIRHHRSSTKTNFLASPLHQNITKVKTKQQKLRKNKQHKSFSRNARLTSFYDAQFLTGGNTFFCVTSSETELKTSQLSTNLEFEFRKIKNKSAEQSF